MFFPSKRILYNCATLLVAFLSPLNLATFYPYQYLANVKCHLHNTVRINVLMYYKQNTYYWWPKCSDLSGTWT
jgi:hypothetical protein